MIQHWNTLVFDNRVLSLDKTISVPETYENLIWRKLSESLINLPLGRVATQKRMNFLLTLKLDIMLIGLV